MERGLVLGKFMPPHAGHLQLVRFAAQLSDQLHVVVGSLAAEPIPGELRAQWMRALLADAGPRVSVLHLTDENPSQPEEHPDFWAIWRASLLRILPAPPTRVFASEPYGARLAQELGAVFVPLDRSEGTHGALSGTAVRAHPARHWDALPGAVRPYFQKRVHVVGPESTGKTTLAKELAQELGTAWVPEYARTWLLRPGSNLDGEGLAPVAPRDMVLIAAGHAANATAAAPAAGPLLFLDTDALTTCVWSRELFGKVHAEVEAAAAAEAPDLTLLMDVDLPWQADSVRYRPVERRDFFDRFEALLQAEQRPYAVVRGEGPARLACALRACARLTDA